MAIATMKDSSRNWSTTNFFARALTRAQSTLPRRLSVSAVERILMLRRSRASGRKAPPFAASHHSYFLSWWAMVCWNRRHVHAYAVYGMRLERKRAAAT